MTRSSQRKADLLAELQVSRAQLSRALRATGEDLDVAARLKQSILHRKTAWFTGAAIVGWVVTRLPGRRPAAPQKPAAPLGWTQKTERAGLLFAVLSFLFNLSKPFLTALATRKIGQLSARSDWGSPSKR